MHNENDGMLERVPLLVSFYRCFQRFQRLLDVAMPDFPDLEDEDRYSWIACLDKAVPAVEGAVSAPLANLAKDAYDAYQGGRVHEIKPPSFGDLPPAQQLAWKCLIRHLSNLLVFDTGEDGDPIGHEERMEGFFKVKLEELLTAQRS